MTTTSELDLTLELDESSMNPDDLSLPALVREVTLQQRPLWLLGRLMNVLEQKRQAKGMGWSRAWNKHGLTIFRTHTHDEFGDGDYFGRVAAFLEPLWETMPTVYAAFGRDLMADPMRMAFTFYHNRVADDGRQYEGLTISLGRKVTADPSKRDRLDIVIEDERVRGRVDGRVDSVRVFVCPWSRYGDFREFHLWEAADLPTVDMAGVQPLYDHCVSRYHEWKHDSRRQWNHWSARFIEYFGPRQFIPLNSAFT